MQFLTIISLLPLLNSVYSKVARPRGVAISKVSFYTSGSNFKCLDGSAVVPFDHINDDYCDCNDGSDEPGTSACPNGSFHCTNAGHKPLNIPSSRVNDGICDCCDGTDEYDSRSHCDNTCKEMGKVAREEAERLKKAVQQGNEIYKEYCDLGSKAKQEKQEQLAELQKNKELFESKMKELQELKEAAELPENEAKEAHKKAWDEEKAVREKERDQENAELAFREMDTNGDSLLSVEEMKAHLEFDIDSSGEVSDEEAKEYLEDKESVEWEVFERDVWPNIKSIYKKPEAEQVTPPPTQESVDEEDYDFDRDVDDEDEEESDDEDESEDGEESKSEEDEMPDYDEATKLLIAAADKARAEFTGAESSFKQAETQLNDVNKFLGLDIGLNYEFFPIKDACYEFTDREYTYKLCPFDKATQRSKTGGSETMLGKWGRWDGPDDDRYSIMYLDQGQSCWNGPNRSVKVVIKCGSTNELVAASEPSRCEYQYVFYTPAACHSSLLQRIEAQKPHDHQEL